jgi:serine/threonine protein kinase
LDAAGTHFIATELIEGVSLRQRLATGRPALVEALDVAIQCASAPEAGHRANIVHRDITPENTMRRPDGLAIADQKTARVALYASDVGDDMAISSDERYALLTQQEHQVVDLMLLDDVVWRR